MLHFASDYMEGAHPRILQKLAETNMEKTSGYGEDHYCESAKEKIRSACNCPDAEIYFLTGGTQTNATVINALLRPYEGVLSAETGHIFTHEAGAIEANGHKILTLPQEHGKISVKAIYDYLDNYCKDENRAHTIKPGMVYISHPTEYGSLYSKAELEEISTLCRERKLPLFLDGARMGYGLMARGADVTLETIASACDVFYIGGTKVGALFGEAVVFTKPVLANHFFTMVKQQGALLAKGRLLGIQFDVLFTNNLYYDISKNAIDTAEKLKNGFREKGYRFYYESPTNQQFIILENTRMKRLAQDVTFSFWEPYDDNHTVVRFATGWATKESDVEKLLELL